MGGAASDAFGSVRKAVTSPFKKPKIPTPELPETPTLDSAAQALAKQAGEERLRRGKASTILTSNTSGSVISGIARKLSLGI